MSTYDSDLCSYPLAFFDIKIPPKTRAEALISTSFSSHTINKSKREREREREKFVSADRNPRSAKIEKESHRKRPIPSDRAAAQEDRTKKKKRDKQHSSSSSSMASSQQVRASHILIKHEGSRRKASWKDPEGRIISATTRDSAVEQLMELREQIESGEAKFEDLAAKHSDCSSAKRGGDLGRFGRGQMQKPFEEATFALKVGEMSGIVDTDSGVHIILRTG